MLLESESKKPLAIFLGKSVKHQEEAAVEWINSGQRPDMHSAVQHYRTKPPEDTIPHLIAPISLIKSFADHKTPFNCCICKTARKFSKDGWLADYGDGFWYIIGPICGSDRYQENTRRGLRSFQHRRAETTSSVALASFYRNFDLFHDQVDRASNAVKQFLNFYQELKKVGDGYLDDLVSTRKNGGQLLVLDKVKNRDFDPDLGEGYLNQKYISVEAPFGKPLAGLEAFQSPYPAGEAWRAITKQISSSGFERHQKEILAEAITTAELAGKSQRLERKIRDILDQAAKLNSTLAETMLFFRTSNLEHLTQWYRKSHRASVVWEIRGQNFSLKEGAKELIHIPIDALISYSNEFKF